MSLQKESEWKKELSEQWNKGSQRIEQYEEIVKRAIANRENCKHKCDETCK